MSFKFQRFQAIEIDIPANNVQTKFAFPDQPQLTGSEGLPVIIDSIEIYTSNQISYSPLTYQTPFNTDNAQSGFLTIYQGDLATINSIPLPSLINTANINDFYGSVGVVQQPLTRNLINVSWTKSFIQFGIAPTVASKICIGVYYTVLQTQEDVIAYLQAQNKY